MGNAWSKHVGEWYEANKGKDGINHLSDAMRSAKCKADFRANNGSPANGPSMKTEKKKNEKKAKKGTRKMRGGSTLGSPANFSADSAVPTDPVASESKMNTPLTPVMKGGKSKRYSLKELMKFIEKNVGMVKGGSKGKMIKGGAYKGNIKFKSSANKSFLGSISNAFTGDTFDPEKMQTSLNEDLKKIDENKFISTDVHHFMQHVESLASGASYTGDEQQLINAFTEYDTNQESHLNDPQYINNILTALKPFLSTNISGVAINTIVAFEKAKNEYKNVMHITPTSDATKFESVKKAIEGVTSTSP